MATKSYTFLGKTRPPDELKLVLGKYTVGAADAYSRADKCQLNFPMLSTIKEVLALHGDLVGNTSNLVALSNALKGAVADDGGAQTDETAAANNATADDMTLLPAVPAVNDAYYFGGPVPFGKLRLVISTLGVGTWTLTWQYYNGSTWATIPDLADGSNNFKASGNIVFSPPSDWATVAVAGITAYWIRARVSAYTAITTQPLGQQAFIESLKNMVLFAPLEGAALSGQILNEKTSAEAYGQIFSYYCLVAGV